jgi:hypothetical protein
MEEAFWEGFHKEANAPMAAVTHAPGWGHTLEKGVGDIYDHISKHVKNTKDYVMSTPKRALVGGAIAGAGGLAAYQDLDSRRRPGYGQGY